MAFKIIDQRIIMAAIGGATIVFAAVSSDLEIYMRIIIAIIGIGMVYKSRFF